jgi:MAE_28990/MAE_18760-like HEPN
MNSSEFHAELEDQRAWREGEIRFLESRCKNLATEKRSQFARMLVVMVYAHLEGFAKFAFTGYVRCINESGIRCGDATESIAAASLGEIFTALRNDKKNKLFRKEIDPSLHQIAREIEFVTSAKISLLTEVKISEKLVNTESNLRPKVLQKNLFRLGLQHDILQEHHGTLDRLVNKRNEIGHGESMAGVDWTDYETLKKASFFVMQKLQTELFLAVENQAYRLKNSPLAA